MIASQQASRTNIAASSPWVSQLAYSRAVGVDGHVFVSGTLPIDHHGQLVGGNDAYLQAKHVLQIIEMALLESGVSTADVVRIRIYLKDYADLSSVAKAQFEVFEHIRPACTVLKSALVREEYLVQIDVDAFCPAHIATSEVG
jgi:enamine deaminase RidA (YjgF/YER057c/UK114 family)